MGPMRGLRLCACVARADRRVTGEQVCLRTIRWHTATSEKRPRTARAPLVVEWPDPEGGDGAPIPVGRLRWHLQNWVAVATAGGLRNGQREEVNGGTQRRMAMAFRWVRLERPLCSVWTRRVRFPGVRALVGSSARLLGGLTGRQLTGPVAEAPEVNLNE